MCSYCGGRDAYRKVRFMIKQIRMLLVALSVIFFMTACKDTAGYTAVQSMWNKDMLFSLKQASLEKAIASYYGGDGTAAAMAFMKHKSVQRFMAMWVHEETKDIDQPIWNYDSFARVSIRNHELKELYTDKQFYSCTFTDGHGRWGYCIFQYDEKESAVSNWEVKETTPYQYDLRANMKVIVDRIMKTDLDILTTSASSVYLYDEEKKQAEQVILFHDENAAYICYYGDAVLRMEKV